MSHHSPLPGAKVSIAAPSGHRIAHLGRCAQLASTTGTHGHMAVGPPPACATLVYDYV